MLGGLYDPKGTCGSTWEKAEQGEGRGEGVLMTQRGNVIEYGRRQSKRRGGWGAYDPKRKCGSIWEKAEQGEGELMTQRGNVVHHGRRQSKGRGVMTQGQGTRG